MITLGLLVWGRKTPETEVTSCQEFITSHMTSWDNLGHSAAVVLVSFLSCDVGPTFTLSLKGVTTDSPQLKNRKLQCSFLNVQELKLLEILWQGDLSLLHLFTDSFMYIGRDSWIPVLYFGLYFSTTLFSCTVCSILGHLALRKLSSQIPPKHSQALAAFPSSTIHCLYQHHKWGVRGDREMSLSSNKVFYSYKKLIKHSKIDP